MGLSNPAEGLGVNPKSAPSLSKLPILLIFFYLGLMWLSSFPSWPALELAVAAVELAFLIESDSHAIFLTVMAPSHHHLSSSTWIFETNSR